LVVCAKLNESPAAQDNAVVVMSTLSGLVPPCTMKLPVSPITVPLFDITTLLDGAPALNANATKLSPLDVTVLAEMSKVRPMVVPAKRKLDPVTELALSVAPAMVMVTTVPAPPRYTLPSPPGDDTDAAVSTTTDTVETDTVPSKPKFALSTTLPLVIAAPPPTVIVVALAIPEGPLKNTLWPPDEVMTALDSTDIVVPVTVVPPSRKLDPALLDVALDTI